MKSIAKESTLTEHLFAENKPSGSSDSFWKFEMVRTIAALYNSGGGILRVGVRDDGTPEGVLRPEDYASDKSKLAEVLHDYLDLSPHFESLPESDYVALHVSSGVLFPSILRKDLTNPKHATKKIYPKGTIFIRRMNGNQASSEPPQSRSDWQKALHLWESNRGVGIQGPLLAQFCLVLNEWNPFHNDEGWNTEVTKWRCHCIADVAGTMGRNRLNEGLKSIADGLRSIEMNAETVKRYSTLNEAGAHFKKPCVDSVQKLCEELGISSTRQLGN